MALKRIYCFWLLSVSLLIPLMTYAQFDKPKYALQIHTRLSYLYGKPTWLIELRDMQSGRILPYIFDFETYDNSWLAYTTERVYRVVASNLKFGPDLVIHNFCGIEDGIIEGKSMFITVTGALTPYRRTSTCRVVKVKDEGLTIINR